jgi:hypothetical protein
MQYKVAPLPISRPVAPVNSFNATYIKAPGAYQSQAIPQPVTPIIGLVSVGNSSITIGVTNHGLNASTMYAYVVYVNGVSKGSYIPKEGVIKITGLPNNYLYKIKVKAQIGYWAGGGNGGSLSAFSDSNFSNEVQGTPEISLAPKSAPSMNTNQVDIKYVSSNVYQKCFPTGISTYGEVVQGEFLDNGKPIYFQPNMLIGTFTAEAVLKAKIHYGGQDFLYGGGVNYVFSDIRINVDTNPFTDLLCFDLDNNDTYSDGDTLSEMYDRRLTQLRWISEVSVASDDQQSVNHFNIDIANQLKREFVLARPYIAEKIKKYMKNNMTELLKSSDALRAFLDVTNLNTRGITTFYKDFILPYEGLIYIKPHIIASTFKEGDNGTTTFSYAMIDENRHVKFTKERVSSSVILAPPQTADSFTFSPLKPLLDESDIFGPTADEFETPLNFNTV